MSLNWFRKLSTPQRIFVSVAGALVLGFLLILVGLLPGRKADTTTVTITVWGVDDIRTWRPTINNFRDTHETIRVDYQQIDAANYEADLVNALAAGNGPDVFMFESSWLPKHGNKVATANTERMSAEAFGTLFPQVAEQDLTAVGRVGALPLSVDTLALVYNRDIFDRKGVVSPPKTWAEFSNNIPELRDFKNGRLAPAAASIGGTSGTIPHADDIISLLMLQNGSPMADINLNRARLFNDSGEEALEFYARFATPQDTLFTWDNLQNQTLDAFANEEVAMIFAYSEELEVIRGRNPFLDFDVEPIPQLDPNAPVNYANYWALAVSSDSGLRDQAWDFVIFATTDEASARSYFEATGRPPALRSLIGNFLNNPDIGVFASQALTAQSWWRADIDEIEGIFDRMIRDVTSGERTVKQALRTADTALTQLMRR